MLQIELCEDLDRINLLLDQDHIGLLMGQFDEEPFKAVSDIYKYVIISDNKKDIGLFIIELMCVAGQYTIHTGFIKSARGALVYAASILFIEFMKKNLPFATLWATPPVSKPAVIKMAQRAGFKLINIIPKAIPIGNRKNNMIKFVDQAIMILQWGND